MNQHAVEEKANALSFDVERGLGRFAGYELKDGNGDVVLGSGHTASLKQIDAFLDNHIEAKASALGLRLTAKKNVKSFDEYSPGEARAVQRQATTGYKIDAREVVIDKGRAGEDRDQREERAKRGDENIIW